MAKALAPLEVLESLDCEALEELLASERNGLAEVVGERQKRIDAIEVLLKASRILRDGKPPRTKPGRKAKAKGTLAESQSPASESPVKTSNATVPGLRSSIVAILKTSQQRPLVLAARCGVDEIQVLDVLRNDEAFVSGERGYWKLAY